MVSTAGITGRPVPRASYAFTYLRHSLQPYTRYRPSRLANDVIPPGVSLPQNGHAVLNGHWAAQRPQISQRSPRPAGRRNPAHRRRQGTTGGSTRPDPAWSSRRQRTAREMAAGPRPAPDRASPGRRPPRQRHRDSACACSNRWSPLVDDPHRARAIGSRCGRTTRSPRTRRSTSAVCRNTSRKSDHSRRMSAKVDEPLAALYALVHEPLVECWTNGVLIRACIRRCSSTSSICMATAVANSGCWVFRARSSMISRGSSRPGCAGAGSCGTLRFWPDASIERKAGCRATDRGRGAPTRQCLRGCHLQAPVSGVLSEGGASGRAI